MRALLLLLPLLLLPALAPTASAVTVVCAADPGDVPPGAVPLVVWAVESAWFMGCSVAEATCNFAWAVAFGYEWCYVQFVYR